MTPRLSLQMLFFGSLLLPFTSAFPQKTVATQTFDQSLTNTQLNGDFGRSVAYLGDVNGDGFGDLLVGKPLHDNGAATDAGAAFLYTGSATGYAAVPTWQVLGTQTNARFGSAVAGLGDVNGDGYMDFAVGAEFFDNTVTDEGAVFVYLGAANPSTTQVARLDGNQGSAYLGSALAGAGDMNGDGFADLVAGSPGFDASVANAGNVSVWLGGTGGGFDVTRDLSVDGTATDARLGASIASAGDVNADGFADIIVGAPTLSSPETNEGLAFLYFGGSSLNGTADLAYQLNQANADFGRSVSGGGDVNGDGFSDVIIGVPLYDDGETDEGAAQVFFGGTAPNNVADLTMTSNQVSANLGFRVASVGDVDGDGFADFAVSAPLLDAGAATDAGRTWVFRGRAGALSAAADVTFSQSPASAQLGRSITGGDYNRDGYADVVVGAPLTTQGATAGAGEVRIARGGPFMPDASSDLTIEGGTAGLGIGTATATGDLNGDGFVDLVVGSPKKNVSSTEDGAFSIYFGSAAGLQLANSVTVNSTLTGANLGNALAVGDVNGDGFGDLIVGAEKAANGQALEGHVLIYFGGAGSFDATPDRTMQGNLANGQLGRSVAYGGDVNGDGYGDVIAGAPFYNLGENNEGAVFVYFGGIDMDTNADVTFQADQGSAFLGVSVAGVGDVNGDGYADIGGGSTGLDFNATNAGGAWIWFGGATVNTTQDFLVSGGQGNARMGFSIAGLGDINNDGYDDFIASANERDAPQLDAGTAFVYLGGTSISTTAAMTLSPLQASGFFGTSVGSAGDLNNDGFADIVVGANRYDDNLTTDSGAAFIYLGGANDTVPDLTLSTTTAGVLMGHSVVSGDFDGDGDPDLAIGGSGFSNGDAGEGGVFVYRIGDIGRLSSPQTFSVVPLAPVDQWGRSQLGDGFYVGMEGISPRGREKGKLEVESCPSTRGFGAPQCSRFMVSTWTDLNSTGSPAGLGAQAAGLAFGSMQHWRARVLYAPFSIGNGGSASPLGPEVGPWRRMQAESGLGDVRISDGFFADSFE